MLVQHAHADHHEARPTQEAGDARRGAGPAGETMTNYHCEIEHIWSRQELSEGVHVDKLPIREPAPPLNQLAPCPENCAAEARQADSGKSQEQLQLADARLEIGRASCRERVHIWAGGGGLYRKRRI